MQWALVDSEGIIQNLIAYDGTADYEPPEGITLQRVSNDLQIGDNIDRIPS